MARLLLNGVEVSFVRVLLLWIEGFDEKRKERIRVFLSNHAFESSHLVTNREKSTKMIFYLAHPPFLSHPFSQSKEVVTFDSCIWTWTMRQSVWELYHDGLK